MTNYSMKWTLEVYGNLDNGLGITEGGGGCTYFEKNYIKVNIQALTMMQIQILKTIKNNQ